MVIACTYSEYALIRDTPLLRGYYVILAPIIAVLVTGLEARAMT